MKSSSAGAFATLAFLLLGGLTFLYGVVAWAYIAAVAGFELWLVRRIRAVGREPVPAGQPPYDFSAEEAELVGRYRFHFTYPGVARQSASVLAAIGLASLVLAPWLTIKQQFVEALIIGVNLFAVARLTKTLSPMLTQALVAHHRSAWAKIAEVRKSGSGS